MAALIPTKKFFLFFLLFVSTMKLLAQDSHFVYIQSDKGQTFYVRISNKVYSSSELGYLIIPKLQSGKLLFLVGFPKNKWKSMNYEIALEDDDLSFRLTNINTSDWELYDEQNKTNCEKKETNDQRDFMQINNDEFSNVLAEVSQNPGIKQRRKIPEDMETKQLKLEVKINETLQQDSIVKNDIKSVSQSEKSRNKGSEKKIENQQIKKDFSFTDSTGNMMKFVITDDGKLDTVSIFIPFAAPQKDKITNGQMESAKNEQKVNSEITQIEEIKSLRKKIAAENDFLQLRKKMILEEDEERMIEITKRATETTCFTSEMVKNLAVLFLDEKNKLSFLLNSYKDVSDKENFKQLQTLLIEEKNLTVFNQLFE